MKTGLSPTAQLRRGIRVGSAQLYVRRRTNKRGSDRILVALPACVRYAVCVWGSYRPTRHGTAFSQELTVLIWEALRLRLGEDAEQIITDSYDDYAKQCADNGEDNIFEVAS
jgi:hypothetical protein